MNKISEPLICDLCKKVHPSNQLDRCASWCQEKEIDVKDNK